MDGSGRDTPFTLAAQPAAAGLTVGERSATGEGRASEEGEAGDGEPVPGERPRRHRLLRLLLTARQLQQR